MKEDVQKEPRIPRDHPEEKTDPESRLRAEIFLREKNWVQALELLVPVLEQSPDDWDLRFRCALAMEGLGQMEAALGQYEEVLARDPQHPETLYRLALECMRQGLQGDCITLCNRLLEIQPEHAEAALLLKKASEPTGIEEFRGSEGHEKPVINAGHPERLRIAFVWGGIPFLGDALDKKPMGGTETAMIHMARSLALMGHEVTVFVKSGRGNFDGVRYAEIERYMEELGRRHADILVAVRTFHPFLVDVPATARILWSGDAHDQPFLAFLSRPEVVDRIDRIFTVSRWQTQMLSKTFHIPHENFFITRNGVSWDHFEKPPETRNRKKLLYTSTPFRGLDVLLDLFPKIKERIPDAELDIYSSMAVYQVGKEEDQTQYGHLYRKAEQPGVTLKGSVTQKELAGALLSAGLLAYPNHFPETSCIAALEALAAGVPVVTSSLGALPETVAAGGVLIDSDSRNVSYHEHFVEEMCSLLNDGERWERLSAEGRDWVYQHHRWEIIAAEWAREFEKILQGKSGEGGAVETREPAGRSAEQRMPVESLAKNSERMDPFFGDFLGTMRRSLAVGGSEMGLGISLFSLAVSIRASAIIEIGRFKGFSTLALGSALKFLDIGWDEPMQHKQRPDMDYSEYEGRKNRRLYSIDSHPTHEAFTLIRENGLEGYVQFFDNRSDEVKIQGQADLIFIDGDHSYEGCKKDCEHFVDNHLRPGGYFILHDYFGWFDENGRNGSPIKRVVDEIISQGRFQHLLMDTGYQSFVVFRKTEDRSLARQNEERESRVTRSFPDRTEQQLLGPRELGRFESFLLRIREETYPEPLSGSHLAVTRKMLTYLTEKYPVPAGCSVLDVGCGQGPALDLFLGMKFCPIGITLNREDLAVCRGHGYEVREMDQSFLDFEDETFPLIWSRHCLEHSAFPFFTLTELFRVLARGGYLYVEVPAAETVARHHKNPNHYSVFGKKMWIELMKRAGFRLIEPLDISLEVPAGSDTYWAFILQKKA